MLTEFEISKILEALWHAERNADHFNKHVWRRIHDRAKEVLPAVMAKIEEESKCQ